MEKRSSRVFFLEPKKEGRIMKKLIAMLVIGGFLAAGVIGCGPTPSTEPEKKPPPKDTMPPPKPKEVKTEGKVTKSADGKITVKSATGDKDFTITDDKVVTIDDKPGKAAEIKVDHTVTITEVDGKITEVKAKSAAAPPPETAPKPVTGKVTKSAEGKITVDGKEYDASTAKVTIDDKPGKAADIKADSTATITFDKEGKVTTVEVKGGTPPPPPPPDKEPKPVTGKVTKSADGKITVEGKEYDASAAKVTIDDKPGKAADIKADSTATITLDKDGKVTGVDVKTK
jgi:hypothetical protein